MSGAFLKSLDEELSRHELVKVKFVGFKVRKRELAPELAEITGACLITLIGNVAVLFRENPRTPPEPPQPRG